MVITDPETHSGCQISRSSENDFDIFLLKISLYKARNQPMVSHGFKNAISLSGLPFGLMVLHEVMPVFVLFLANSIILSIAGLLVNTISGFKNSRYCPDAYLAPRLQPLEKPLFPVFLIS